MKPYYEKNGITIYHGDHRDFLVQMFTAKIPLVVTSPPYNLGSSPWPHLGHWKQGNSAGGNGKWKGGPDAGKGVGYGKHSDSMPWEEYVEWQRRLLGLLWECLSDDGAIFYNHKPRVIGHSLWTPLELLLFPRQLRQIIVWKRPGGMNFNPTAFMPTHEWVMVLAKPAWRLKSRGVSGLGDVWEMPPDRGNPHPAPFPLSLPTKALEATDAELVLDPCMGSGTTLLAAQMMGRRAIGIELEERYCEIAAKRLQQEVLFV